MSIDLSNINTLERKKLLSDIESVLHEMDGPAESPDKRRQSNYPGTDPNEFAPFEEFDINKDPAWLLVKEKKDQKLIDIIISAILKLFFHKKFNLGVKEILNLRKELKKFNPKFFNFSTDTTRIGFANYLVPISVMSKKLPHIFLEADSHKDYQTFSRELISFYLADSSLGDFMEQFSDSRISDALESRGLIEGCKSILLTRDQELRKLQKTLPKPLLESLFYIDLFNNLHTIVNWEKFFVLFGRVRGSKVQEAKKDPGLGQILHQVVQLYYVLSKIPNSYEDYQHFIFTVNHVQEDLINAGELKAHVIDTNVLRTALQNLFKIKKSDFLKNLIRYISHYEQFIVGGIDIHFTKSLKKTLTILFDSINDNLYRNYKVKMQIFCKEQSVKFLGTDNPALKINATVYNETNAHYLSHFGIHGFQYASMVSIILFYHKYNYANYVKIFFVAISDYVLYFDSTMSSRLKTLTKNVEDILEKLSHYIYKSLTSDIAENSFIEKFLDFKDDTKSDTAIEAVRIRVGDYDSVVKDFLDTFFQHLRAIRQEIGALHEDLGKSVSSLIINSDKLPTVKKDPFIVSIKKVTASFDFLLSLEEAFNMQFEIL